MCVQQNCSEEFCSSVVKRWSDKHNNDASANNHRENKVTEVKYNLIFTMFPFKYITDIWLWTTALTDAAEQKTWGDKNLMWLYVKQTGKDRKQKREREREFFWESRYIFHSTGCNNGKQSVFGFRKKNKKQQHGETAQVQQISLLIIISMFVFMTASDMSKSYCFCCREMFFLWRLDFAWL